MTPRSPWIASAGCRKKAGVPVLARVAAIFWQLLLVNWLLAPSRYAGDRRGAAQPDAD